VRKGLISVVVIDLYSLAIGVLIDINIQYVLGSGEVEVECIGHDNSKHGTNSQHPRWGPHHRECFNCTDTTDESK
jgi:hypothetical protein